MTGSLPVRLTLLPWLMLLLAGCTLLAPPERPVIPTAVFTAPEDAVEFDVLANGATPDATAGIRPGVDPGIAAIVDSVSRQNLFAYIQTLQNFGTRHSLSVTESETYGIGVARRWIYDEFSRVGSGRLEVTIDPFVLNFEGTVTEQQNIVATLPGVGDHPGTIIMLAHYDSRTSDPLDAESVAPGANDNGSGVALLLEAARLLSAGSWNQTIIFVATAGEEQGTFGSRHYVQEIMLDGMIVDAALNNDIIGGRAGISRSVRIFASGPETSGSLQLARYISFVGELYVPTFGAELQPELDREGRFGDQREFVDAGVPAVRFVEAVEDFGAQHSGADTAEKIDYTYLMQVTALNVAAVATMAAAPPPPLPPTVAFMADGASYLLTWTPDPRAETYAVLARPVGSPQATMRFVGSSEAGSVVLTGFDPNTRYALSLAALDSAGHISLYSEELLTP